MGFFGLILKCNDFKIEAVTFAFKCSVVEIFSSIKLRILKKCIALE